MFETYLIFVVGMAVGVNLTLFISWINSMREKLKEYENEKEIIKEKQKDFDMDK